ncbi:SAM-dependent methyltransferase [Actinoplanes sp. L3-i22]|uniref:SAM-dependent methyltransferase n=1 Tax=Actinoplanes sp. L3-i22 TaxID=2836373 RepID=UPI001C79668D|nr:SAM-dependent methyltransferase [Actinoplanes sp. L3-i22]BCY11072.1 hypothetical protein L3i22_061600 [Actinoplanes sp. L3-i22]
MSASVGIDTGTPQSARIYNYRLGGKDNVAVGRVACYRRDPGMLVDAEVDRVGRCHDRVCRRHESVDVW